MQLHLLMAAAPEINGQVLRLQTLQALPWVAVLTVCSFD